MRHNLNISVSKEPKSGGIVACKTVTLREKLLTKLMGSNGSFTMTLQNGTYNKTWSFSDVRTGGVVCDGEQMNFFFGSTLLNDKVTGDGFPEFPPGETTITTSGQVSMVNIQPRWCCL